MTREFPPYDQRHYQTVDVREGYRRWSGIYDEGLAEGLLDIALLEGLSVEWRVARAVDLACGTGRIGAWLVARGTQRIAGVDLTPEMLAVARQRGVYERIECEDACATSLEGGSADLVVSVLAVEHMPDIEAFYAEGHRLLRGGGRLVVIGYHPHFLLNGIPTHFEDEAGENIAITNHIHLFSDHVGAARARSLELCEMEERVVDDDWVARMPSYQRHLGRPVTFAMVWKKPA
jgi:SAM-dependent methyltransferase